MSSSLDDLKRRLLARAPLADLIGETVALERRAGHLVGCCPFHAEKTPSFYVYPDHYHCYGCKEHGDAISFVRQKQGLGYVDALRHLAAKYGVEAPELEESRSRLDRQRQDASLFKMMLDTQELYTANLHGPHGAEARAYLVGRGLSEASLKDFGFGLTPQEPWGLHRHLRSKGYHLDDMVACSLCSISARDGKPLDFLRRRVTLPIHEAQGRIVAFGGRTLDGAHPKYLHSSANRLFDKSSVLFGLNRARAATAARGRAIVTEGYMDTLMLWQAGFPETVAALGTAFNETQLRQLSHATSLVILLFDGDTAGQKATLAAVNVALAVPKVRVKAAVLPDGVDPDDFVREHGAPALEALLAGSVDLFDLAIRDLLKKTPPLGVPDLVQNTFVPWLAQLPDELQSSFLMSRVAQLTGIPAATMARQLAGADPAAAQAARAAKAAARADGRGKVAPIPARGPLSALARTTVELFGHVYHSAPGELDAAALQTAARTQIDLGPEHQALLDELLLSLAAGEAPAQRPLGLWTAALDPELATLLGQLATAAAAYDCNDRPARVALILAEDRRRQAKATIQRLKGEVSRAAADPARAPEVTQILRTIAELTKLLELRPAAAPTARHE